MVAMASVRNHTAAPLAASGSLRELLHAEVPSNRERVLDFVRVYHALHGAPPSIPEIMEGTGVRSSGTVHRHLCQLVAEGALAHFPRTRGGAFVPTSPLVLAGDVGEVAR